MDVLELDFAEVLIDLVLTGFFGGLALIGFLIDATAAGACFVSDKLSWFNVVSAELWGLFVVAALKF